VRPAAAPGARRAKQPGDVFCQLQAALAGEAQRHPRGGVSKVLGIDTGLTTGASEHDTVSVLAAVEVVLY
jgi:hypothetical protein